VVLSAFTAWDASQGTYHPPPRAVFELVASPRGELGGVPEILWERRCFDYPARGGFLAVRLEPSIGSPTQRVGLQRGETRVGSDWNGLVPCTSECCESNKRIYTGLLLGLLESTGLRPCASSLLTGSRARGRRGIGALATAPAAHVPASP